MFTGIITDVGAVRAIEHRGDTRMVIATAYDLSRVEIGASIACSGACLTVVDKGDDWFAVDVSAETLTKTNLSDWQVGSAVNLERALKIGDELGGHIVTGHVDGIATVEHVQEKGESHIIAFSVPADIAPYIAPKGSVTLDGVSLTVNEVSDIGETARFTVNIIPHTWDVTTLNRLATGSQVDVEIDVLARYLARLKDRVSLE